MIQYLINLANIIQSIYNEGKYPKYPIWENPWIGGQVIMSSKGVKLLKAVIYILCIGIAAGAFFIVKDHFSMKAAIAVSSILFLLFVAGLIVSAVASAKARKAKKNSQNGTLITQLKSSSERLSLKVSAMKDSFAEEKKIIENIAVELGNIHPVKDVNASKAEQDILVKITSVSSLIDGVIAGSDPSEFKKQLTVLYTAVKQRKQFEN